jgi:hypothetical protein
MQIDQGEVASKPETSPLPIGAFEADESKARAVQGAEHVAQADVSQPPVREAQPDDVELWRLCAEAGVVPTLPMRILIQHPSTVRELEPLLDHLRQVVNRELTPVQRADAARQAAMEFTNVMSSEEGGASAEVLHLISLKLHPSCAAFRRALDKAQKAVEGLKLGFDELVVVMTVSAQAKRDDRSNFLKQAGPLWREMIQLAVCTSDDVMATWSAADAEAVVKGIRAYFALVNCASMSTEVFDHSRSRHFLHPFTVNQESLASYLNVALPLWDRVVRVMREVQDPPHRHHFEHSNVARQQAALWHHLRANCYNDIHPLPIPSAFAGLSGGDTNEDQTSGGSDSAELALPSADHESLVSQSVPTLQVIHGPIPRSSSREDVDVIKQFDSLASTPLPVTGMPDGNGLRIVLETLRMEFPWATSVMDEVGRLLELRALMGCRELMIPPLLLAGPPGTGKSRFARRIAQLLGLPFQVIGLGGSHDVKLLTGTARGWGGGCPSPLLTHMLQDRSASALVLLDEIDKCATYQHGQSPLANLLLTLLEPETSSRYRDGFLLTRCDLSRLMYVATANSLDIPKPLLSRFTVLHMPAPRPQDRMALATSMLGDMADEMGVPRAVMPDVPRDLADQFNGNARALRVMLQRYLFGWAKENLSRDRVH